MGGGKLRIFLLHLVGHIFASLDFAFEIQSDGLCLSNATVSLCNVLIDMVVFWSLDLCVYFSTNITLSLLL